MSFPKCIPRNMLFLVFVLMVSAECYAKRSAACSLEFSLIGSKCYYFSKESLSWNDAFYQCIGKNSSLAIFNSTKEDRQMRNYLKRHSNSLGVMDHWIGGKYDWRNSKWVWAETGKPVKLKTLPKTLPTNTILLHWSCLMMDSNRMNKLSPISCPRQNHFICQKNTRYPIGKTKSFNTKICRKSAKLLTDNQKVKCLRLVGGYGGVMFQNIPAPIIQTPKPTAKNVKEYVCPSNMFVIKNRCYHFSHQKLNWNDAYWACRDNKTYLAVILNKAQDKKLREFLDSGFVGRYERWLGGLYDWKQKRWLWANSGTPLKYHGFQFRNSTGEGFEWKSITMDPNIRFKWNSRLRTEQKYFICQKRAKTIAKLGDFNTALY
ncbi:C-type lectin domain family 2 member G-like isoform X2 [Harmonia axyridis]|uniref:C-type lectin domain family 2 member G-like isoform X2 n=1 Tax=Harmonia axyridis TaxID=115357 RepID=UPI001E278015|nr:C-type lectin domain family 2 member G-like isoform X2 [Harmonia axyridis]